MRILFAIAHYYKFLDKTAPYASLNSDSKIRLNNLSNCIASLYQTFSPFQSAISWIDGSAYLANQIEVNEIDIIICTTQGHHLLDNLTIPDEFYQHNSTEAEPFLLGFECQKILLENIEKYDYFCFLEDDIIIQDPLFFTKLNWFNFGAGNSCLLQPNRYEVTEVQKPFKAYIDGNISPLATQNFQNIEEEYEIEGDLLTIPVIFRRPLNPHSGCYFLNQEQMKYWSEQSYFLDKDTSFVGPLESAATLGIMKTFRIYKTIPEQANLFEVRHSGSRYLTLIGDTINQQCGWEKNMENFQKTFTTEGFDLNYQDKTLQQFESNPYPNMSIAASPQKDVALLYKNSLLTAYYHRYQRILDNLSNCVILDLACGTGITTLTLAEANRGAKIIATDISQKSLKIAEERLTHHGFHNVEYHLLALEEINQLDFCFDYINASDILYLLPDISLALKQLASVLKPKGIIRGNLHSYYQRLPFYRSQNLFSRMGLMEGNPGEVEVGIVRDFFTALKDTTDLKIRTRGSKNPEKLPDEELLMNYLLQNDNGYTIPQLLEYLEQAGLSLIDMVDWREWQLTDLFNDPEDLPAFLAMGFADLALGEELSLYELIQPNKRLLDFWCGHPDPEEEDFVQTIDSKNEDWRNIQVYLHPQLKTEEFKQEALSTDRAFPINLKNYVPYLVPDIWLDRILVNGLFAPLFEQSRSLDFLVDRWLKIQPVNPVTLMPTTETQAFVAMSEAVIDQEKLGVILLDRTARKN